MDSTREGVAGGNKLGIYTGGYIAGKRGCRMLCRSSCFISSVRVCVTVDNLAGEFLPRKEIIGCGAKVGDRYASVAEWHLAVSEQSFVLDLIGQENVHSHQITSEVLSRVSWDNKSVQLSIKSADNLAPSKARGLLLSH